MPRGGTKRNPGEIFRRGFVASGDFGEARSKGDPVSDESLIEFLDRGVEGPGHPADRYQTSIEEVCHLFSNMPVGDRGFTVGLDLATLYLIQKGRTVDLIAPGHVRFLHLAQIKLREAFHQVINRFHLGQEIP